MPTFQAALATLAFFSCCLPAAAFAQTAKAPEVAAKIPEAKAYQGLHVGLEIESSESVLFNEMDVVITFFCTQESSGGPNPYLPGVFTHRILNTSMSPLMDLPGDLVIRDARGKEVNRITDRTQGSFISPSDKDYVQLHPGKLMGSKVHVQAAHNRESDEWLANGEYTMQFEMHPQAIGLAGDRRTPVVRSEPVKFRLGKKPDDGSAEKPGVAVAVRLKNRDDRLDVSLRATSSEVVDGDLEIELIFACRGKQDVTVVDPGVFRHGIIGSPGHFVVRDSTGKVVSRFPEFLFVTGHRLDADNYINLPPRGFIGAKLQVRAGWSVSTGDLPAGDYTLEFAASEQLFDFNSKETAEKTISEAIKFRISE